MENEQSRARRGGNEKRASEPVSMLHSFRSKQKRLLMLLVGHEEKFPRLEDE